MSFYEYTEELENGIIIFADIYISQDSWEYHSGPHIQLEILDKTEEMPVSSLPLKQQAEIEAHIEEHMNDQWENIYADNYDSIGTKRY